jgi:NDP-sugar pyrophosphorylase family protein
MVAVSDADETAIILAGGLGTRLGTLTADLPKPMLPIAGRPFVEYVILQLKRSGYRSIVFACGHRSEDIRRYFGDGRRLGLSIQYSNESEPLGTGGAIRRAAAAVSGGPLLVMNGDSFFDIDPRAVHGAVRDDVILAMALAAVPDAGRFGRVRLSADGSIVGFTAHDDTSGEGTINAGIYGLGWATLELIGDGPASLEHEVLPSLVGRGLSGMASAGFFVDIGLPETYVGLSKNPDPLLAAIGVEAIG